MKCLICLESGRALDLAKVTTQPDWDNLIMADLLILGSEDGLIRVFLRPREFATPNMLALDSAFHQDVYNKVASITPGQLSQES